MSKTIFYARVSTNEQTCDHQEQQARQAGYDIDEVIADHGTSGVTTKLSERPNGKRLFDMLRDGDVLVVRWVDRLGRNYQDVTDTIRTVINRMTFDGSTTEPTQQAVRDALIAFMAATAQAQAEATKEAQKAGIAFHKDASPEKFRGRKPTFDRATYDQVMALLEAGQGHSAIAKTTGLQRNAVIRIATDPVKVDATLTKWSM
jgi:putative DNA-invertase from lambdoid prophage Rac